MRKFSLIRSWAVRLLSSTLAALLLISHAVAAQDPLIGTWQGTLEVAANSKVLVQFIIEKKGSAYAATLNAPREPNLQNVPVNAVSFEQGQLTLKVDAVSGIYQGKLESGALRGTWVQQGTSFPLALSPYVKAALSRDSMRRLVGTWHGKVRPPALPNGLVLVMRFEMNAKGELAAFLDVPEQSLYGLTQEVSVTTDNKLSFRHTPLKIEYTAELNDTDMVGEFRHGRVGPLPLVMQRGAYKEPPDLMLSKESRERVRGAWHGQLRGLMTLVLRFSEARDGSIDVTVDSPDQGIVGLPVNNVQLNGEQLSLTVPGIGATLKGSLATAKITGQYVQSGQTINMTFERGEYVGHKLQLPAELTSRLVGRWEGIAGNTPLVFRFERDGRGESFAFIDIPSAKLAGLPVTAVRSDGAAISFVARGIEAEFKGQLAANQMSGKWTTASVQLPLVIKRSTKGT